MRVNDTVYFLGESGYWEEATVFMFGGDNQVLLSSSDRWELADVGDVKTPDKMTDSDWENSDVYKS